MNYVNIDKVSRTLPASWNELSRSQLLFACSMFNRSITAPFFKAGLLSKFLRIKKRLWNKMDITDIYYLSQTLNFVLEDVTLTKSLIKTIRCPRFPWTRLYGPQDAMNSSTFGEFTMAQENYEQYNKTGKQEHLDKMVAILYRRKKHFWWITRHFVDSTDSRVRLKDCALAERSKSISRIDPLVKQAVFLFFSGVQNSLPGRFPNVYRPKPKSDSTKPNGWVSLIISLADGKTDDQSLERIMNSNLYNVFLGLEDKSTEYFDFLKKYPSND